MTENIQKLVDTIVNGIQEKKGHNISVIDMQGMEGVICQAFVVCEGGSPSQVSAICDSVEEMMRKEHKEKPTRIAGLENSIWVAMDYVDIIVHIFLPDARDFYSLESLWQDAPTIEIPDIE
ncbi:MAG: ribosome silencing factor [Prevotella sp.]|nr:ribosome silencing factor [Prevotella sp.]MBQ8115351.1 ribosome silencing factor [Prevotella sp.]